jgi:uncharacterized membrane protein YdfJ with MMPL/SSD domain
MMTVILATVSALAVLVLILAILLVLVVLGIRQEPTDTELRHKAPSRTSQAVRRLLGVYVRRPDEEAEGKREACLAGHRERDGR